MVKNSPGAKQNRVVNTTILVKEVSETKVPKQENIENRPEKVVPATGLEPVRCYSLEPESSASANSATRA